MIEVSSPGPATSVHKQRLQSPTSPFFLGSNDDALERAQARAARAAALRRRSFVSVNPYSQPQSGDGEDGNGDPGLKRQQILELFQNCIKLASENKINQKNTWELGLIDHMHEIIKVEVESEAETNFQKASCTLEAGVKIYSLRVDSVHSEAYKVLGGINRVGNGSQQDGMVENPDVPSGGAAEEDPSKKDAEKKLSPLSTLESSFEALNVKKFDVAFLVDPLYHHTSAQFDEGGAKGLLMNNLGVYGGCRVLFDSLEVPGKCISCNSKNNSSDKVDLSFARDCFEQMQLAMLEKKEITPTLREIVDQFDELDRRPTGAPFAVQEPDKLHDPSCSADIFEAEESVNDDPWDFHQDDDDAAVGAEDLNSGNPTFYHGAENEGFSGDPPDGVAEFEELESFLFLGLGYTGKYNAWAGPEHWKFLKPKASEEKDVEQNNSHGIAKKTRNKKGVVDIDFTNSLDKKTADIFAPPKNPKTLLLPASRMASNIRLPEDCHYQPENLVKLFLLPNVMCIGRTQRKQSDDLRATYDNCGPSTSWDSENGFEGPYDDADIHSDVEETSLVLQPRQVNKIEVKYDKTSKQVDVQLLKETLWHHIQQVPEGSIQKDPEEAISFKKILAGFPADCRAASTIGDISPHLSFICLLHLANEHGLVLRGCDDLDDVTVNLPRLDMRANGG
ncbi:hypothetical protein MLD38_003038 [Melastoma candidum]|uniref:Uncharacterized protein n=1 Tax=Melastoma candidum TaxID=119954 RepID=A0ACB9S397_9MYRT|nr:hypothetical protein MLD38_003038 [Melastoma candidum]